MLRRLRSLSRRQRALVAAGVGAAAAAAYYLGTVALEAWEKERALAQRAAEQQALSAKEERETERQCVRIRPPAHSALTSRCTSPRLHEHFDAIQQVADTKTLPPLLPPLRARLFAACDVEALTARLREPSLSAADKVALWEELKLLGACARAPPRRTATSADILHPPTQPSRAPSPAPTPSPCSPCCFDCS